MKVYFRGAQNHPESTDSSLRGKESGRESDSAHVATTNRLTKILRVFFSRVCSSKKPLRRQPDSGQSIDYLYDPEEVE